MINNAPTEAPRQRTRAYLRLRPQLVERHIESDFLLIWIDESTNTVWLERLGSHSELFR